MTFCFYLGTMVFHLVKLSVTGRFNNRRPNHWTLRAAIISGPARATAEMACAIFFLRFHIGILNLNSAMMCALRHFVPISCVTTSDLVGE